MPAGDFRALGARDQGRRLLLKSRSDLLAAPVAPRPRAAEPEEQQEYARHVLAALAGAAEPDRDLDRQIRRHRGQHRAGAWARLPRRDTAARHQTRPLRVHAARAPAARRFRDGVDMKRRTFVAGLAASVGVSRMSLAQTGQVPEVVLFYAGPVASAEARAKLIREALSADGLVEGKNYALSISVATDNGQLPALAEKLVRPGVSAVLAVGPVALRAARTASATIPIVALDLETDPIKAGFAQSLSHPGGNVTGIFFDFPEYSGKLLELLNEA